MKISSVVLTMHFPTNSTVHCSKGGYAAASYLFHSPTMEAQPSDKDQRCTSARLMCSVCPPVKISTWVESVIVRPFLDQVMTGGGTAFDSHSSDTEVPSLTLTTERDSLP